MRSGSTSSSHATSYASAAGAGGEQSGSVQRSQQSTLPAAMQDRRSAQGSMAPRSQFPGGYSAAPTASGAPWQAHGASASATPQGGGESAAWPSAAVGASRGNWTASLRPTPSAGFPAMPMHSASGPGQVFGGGNSGSETAGSWMRSLREPSSSVPSGTPGSGSGAPAAYYDYQDTVGPLQTRHSIDPPSGPQLAANPSPAATAGSRGSPSIWRSMKKLWPSGGSSSRGGRGGSITLQQPYSQTLTLDTHEAAVRDPENPYHTLAWEEGTCSGVAAEWLIDRVRHADSSSGDRIARLNSEQGLRSALNTQHAGHGAHLVGSLTALGGSVLNGQRAAMSAMLEPGGIDLAGEPSQFRLSRRGSTQSIGNAISAPGLSLIDVHDMQSRRYPGQTTGHMLSAYSDGSRIEIFDANRGEFHADVSDAGTLFKSLLGHYSDAHKMDKVLVQRLTPSEGGSQS